jgi:hypothetical protein
MIKLPEDEVFLEELTQLREWFSDKLCESAPLHPDDITKMHRRMIQVGWLRQSEMNRYDELMKEEDD